MGGGGAGGGTGNNGVDYSRVYSAKEITVLDGEFGAAKRKLTPEEEKRQQLTTKLAPALVAVVDRLKDAKAQPGADEAGFVREGRAEIQVWLTDKSEEALAQLKQLGFEVVLDPKTAKLVIGRLPVEKLEALAALTFVRYVAPQKSSRQ